MKKRKNLGFLIFIFLIVILSNNIFISSQMILPGHDSNKPFWQPQAHDLNPNDNSVNACPVFMSCWDVAPFQCGRDHCNFKDEFGNIKPHILCGMCPEGTVCDYLHTPHTCVTCTPNCDGKSCGPNGCGGTCGTCTTGQTCNNGQCEANKQQSCPNNCPLPNICCSLFNKISNNNQVFFCVPPEKIPEKFCNVPQTYCGDGIVQTPNSQGQNEECDAGKSCIYDPAPDKKKCKSSNDCKEFNTNGLKCDACANIDTIQCTKDCKCNGMYFKKPEKTCAINDKGSYFIINRQGYWERNFKNNKCSISDYSEISLNSKECSNCKKCSLDYPYKTINLKKGEESFVYFDIYNSFEISISPTILTSEGGLYIDIEKNIKIPSKTNKVIKFKVIGYNCGKFKNKISIKLLNYVYDVYVYANVNCGECKYNYNENEFNIEPVCNTDSEKEGKVCDSPKLRDLSKIDSSTLDRYPSSVDKYCEKKEGKGICYQGECVFECENIQNEEDFEKLTGIDLKWYDSDDLSCLQNICRAVRTFPENSKKKFNFYLSISNLSKMSYGGVTLDSFLIEVKPYYGYCFRIFKHEAAHFLSNKIPNTWPGLENEYLKDVTENELGNYVWKTSPYHGPKLGFAYPYGATNWEEDIATFTEVVGDNPSVIGEAMKDEESYSEIYKDKLNYLYGHGYISCEEYHAVLYYAGIEK